MELITCLLFHFAGFPNRAVVEAYTRPEVNQSRAKFSWADPNVDALRDFLNEKIGWNREKFNSVVVPVLERFKSKEVFEIVHLCLGCLIIFITF